MIQNFILDHCWQGCLSGVPLPFGLANMFFISPVEVGSGFLPSSWSWLLLLSLKDLFGEWMGKVVGLVYESILRSSTSKCFYNIRNSIKNILRVARGCVWTAHPCCFLCFLSLFCKWEHRPVTGSWRCRKAAGCAGPARLVFSPSVCCVPRRVVPWSRPAVAPSGSTLVVLCGFQR